MPNDPRDAAHPGASVDLTGKTVGRYRIDALIGAGGMGEVYRAFDTTLRRDVALKRIHRGSATGEENRRRVLREARAACALEHRAIAAVYDVLESGGEAFIVEELVRGVPLSAKLGRPVDLAAFFTIAFDCCDALETAAANGIVHCDLKPGNIFITDEGRPRILDFGLARFQPTDPQATTETLEMRCAGTPGYMAPEVARGEAATFASDLFSLGVVFYELLAGAHPFRQSTAAATLASALRDDPPPPSVRNPSVPPALDHLVRRLLEKDPARRYARAADVARDLEAARAGRTGAGSSRRRVRVAAAIAAVALGAAAVFLWPRARPPAAEGLPGGLLLVRDFECQGCEGAIASFADGLTEAVQIRLAEMPGVNVAAASSGLGAAVALEGSVLRSDGRLRIHYRLLDTKRSVLLGGDVIEGSMADLFDLEDRVTHGATQVLADHYGLAKAVRPAARSTEDVTAYDLYLQARGYLHRYQSEGNVEVAAGLFEKALARDPRFALASAGLGEAYWRRYEATRDTAWAHEAERVSKTALEDGAHLAETHVTLGTVYVGTGRTAEAAAEFRKALAIDPGSDAAYRGLARAEEAAGNLAAAEETYRTASRARPDYWAGHNDLGVFLFRHGRYEEAREAFQRVVELTPDNARGYSNLGAVLQSLGRDDDAVAAYERSLALQPNHRAYSNLASLHSAHGRFDDAAGSYEKALALAPNDYRIWGSLGGALRLAAGAGARADSVRLDARADSALRRALALAEEQREVNPDDGLLAALVAQYHADLGERPEARRSAERALALAPDNAEVLAHAAAAFEILGDRARALAVVEEALEAGYEAAMLRRDPSLADLVGDARFAEIARRVRP